jgi:hypothetical protein
MIDARYSSSVVSSSSRPSGPPGRMLSIVSSSIASIALGSRVLDNSNDSGSIGEGSKMMPSPSASGSISSKYEEY